MPLFPEYDRSGYFLTMPDFVCRVKLFGCIGQFRFFFVWEQIERFLVDRQAREKTKE